MIGSGLVELPLRARNAARIAVALTVAVGGTAAGARQARAQLASGQASPVSSAPSTGDDPAGGGGASSSSPTSGAGAASGGSSGDLFTRSNLLGDAFGARSYLAGHGITYGITETSEVLGNVTGGIHTGADYDGLTTLSAGIDTDKLFGLPGGIFNVSAFEIHGRSLSVDNLDTIQTASGIEAQDTFRLWELWYDQATRSGNLDLKIGQQSLDQEFMTSTYSSLFINTAMGWPALPSFDLYAGGPAYPLSSLGVRLRGSLGPFTALAGVYDDNPPGGPFDDDSQLRGAERSGTLFNLNTGALFIAEIQYGLNQPVAGQDVKPGEKPAGLPGTYRIGAWFDTGQFPDQRFDANGISLADEAETTGEARLLRHNFSAYASLDQEVWADGAGVRSLGAFLRVMGAPDDRNEISFSADTGLSLKAPLTARPNDTLGVGYGIAKVSPRLSAYDQDFADYSGDAGAPIQSSESFVEVAYQAQIAPWWQLEPDFQYVWTPGGGIANPAVTTPLNTRVGNEAVFGVRTNITF